ncbi:MAG: serine/threonine-protein kinase [Myxococcota bacterium]
MGGGSSESDAIVGQRVGKYQVLKRLATGGMAELFLARSTGIEGFQKVVALKRILPQLADNEDFVEMFLHEARLAASLEHPNIVHVSDFGKAGNDYFFVMAYVHGRDLLAILRNAVKKRKRPSIEDAITIALGTCEGLHYAHEHVGFDGKPLGIVHRDVSPTNVLVSYDGHVKLVDFGIAKAAAQNSTTRAGVRKGKAAYMSPEQCRGTTVDRRSDVWSMGVVLFEMTTMVRLYKAESELAIMHKIVNDPVPSLREVDPKFPPALEQIILKCLRHEPAERYQSARELQQELQRFAVEHDMSPSASGLSDYMKRLFGAPEVPWSGLDIPFGPGSGGTQTVDYAATRTAQSPVGHGTDGVGPIEPTPVSSPSNSNVVSVPHRASMWSGTNVATGPIRPPSRALWIGGGALVGLNAAVLVWWLSSWLAANQTPAPAPAPASTSPAVTAPTTKTAPASR